MDSIKVRICQIEIKGFKNTKYGLAEMPLAVDKDFFTRKADILGIYGQNGSGKTALIEAMEFIQILLIGKSLPSETVQYISKETESCIITVKFIVETMEKTALTDYSIEFKRGIKDELEIAHESLEAALWNGEKFHTRKILIDYDQSSKGVLFTPKYRYEEMVRSNEENKINLGVAKKITQKDHCSFIFGTEGRTAFLSSPENISGDYAYIIQALHQYAAMNLFVISNAHSGAISMNLMIPFAFRLDIGEKVAKGDLPVRLDGPSIISTDHFNLVKQIIDEMNIVLYTMIPDLSIGIHEFGEQLMEQGSIGHKIELISKRGETIIPLKYESEGIIKIISILNVLMSVYNHPSMCLIMDELDAGIFEYLLGELITVFEKGAKGQLIFTSHNLRILEMLNKKSIVFSTTNPENRYIRLQNLKGSNNLRDMYLRSITLGGQKEDIYAETDSVEMGRAFRRCGKAMSDGTKY